MKRTTDLSECPICGLAGHAAETDDDGRHEDCKLMRAAALAHVEDALSMGLRTCVACGGQNSALDGECQWCECGGASCRRDSCSSPEHFHAEHIEPEPLCETCRDAGPADVGAR